MPNQLLMESLSAGFPEGESWRPRYSMAPRQTGLVLSEEPDADGELVRVMRKATWGIKGAVWDKPEVNSINARESSLFRVAKWRELFRGAGATVLIPMTGYTEFVAPRSDPAFKVPVHISDDQAPVLTAAGLYDAEQDGYVILTMDAELATGEVHTRQPIFVPEEMRDRWLQVGAGETPGKGQPDKHKEVLAELRDYSRTETERLSFYAGDREFNNVRALGDRVYDADLIAPSPEMQHLLDTEGFDPGLSPRERAAAKKTQQ